jgi:DNA repair protein RadC
MKSKTAHVRSENALQYEPERSNKISAEEAEILKQADAILLRLAVRNGDVIKDPMHVQRWLKNHCCTLQNEIFGVLYLDTRHRIIAAVDHFTGTIDGASVHVRIIAAEALRRDAKAVIVYHNHPSGVPTPSAADEALTRSIKSALSLIEVSLLDHIIVAADKSCSLAELGLIV